MLWTSITAFFLTRSFLERNATEGDSPVEVKKKVLRSLQSIASWKRGEKLGDINL